MNHSMTRIWAGLFVVLVIAYGGWAAYRNWTGDDESIAAYIGEAEVDPDYKPADVKAPAEGKDLRFIERSGREFKFSEMEGKIWIASFFFTACPGECKILNNEIAKLRHEYRDKDVTFVSITCDPENDTLEELRKYAAIYSADPDRWLFVRGDPDNTSFIGITRFKVSVVKKSHSDRMILIKPDGEIEDYFNGKQPSDMLKVRKALDKLLEAEASAPTPKEETKGSDEPSPPQA